MAANRLRIVKDDRELEVSEKAFRMSYQRNGWEIKDGELTDGPERVRVLESDKVPAEAKTFNTGQAIDLRTGRPAGFDAVAKTPEQAQADATARELGQGQATDPAQIAAQVEQTTAPKAEPTPKRARPKTGSAKKKTGAKVPKASPANANNAEAK